MATKVAGSLYYEIDGQLAEIKRQLRQPDGYPFCLTLLKCGLQELIEGKYGIRISGIAAIAETRLNDGSIISTVVLGKQCGSSEFSTRVLGIVDSSNKEYFRMELINRGHTLTNEQSREMLAITKKGEGTGMNASDNGRKNLFFCETGNPETPVVTSIVDYDARCFHSGDGGFGNLACFVGDCFLIRNFPRFGL